MTSMTNALQGTIDPVSALSRSSFFSVLPEQARDDLVPWLKREDVSAGQVVVREGEEGDSYYLIADGEAEVWTVRNRRGATVPWTPDSRRHVRVARLGPGNGFGEMALLLGGARRATVVAATPLVLYVLDAKHFRHALEDHRGLQVALEEEMALRAVHTSLGQASPFANLGPDSLRWLALRFTSVSVEPGDDAVRQGEPGDAFYIVRSGRLQVVVRREDGSEYSVATLGPGDPFGEQALVTDDARSASVRAVEVSEVLRLSREDFRTVLEENPERDAYFAQLTLQRQRPRRIDQWSMERQATPGGKAVWILKDDRYHRYVKLSEEAAFLWQEMDGERTVRDLTRAYYERYHVVGLDAVKQAMVELSGAGFLKIQRVDPKHSEEPEAFRLYRRGMHVLTRIFIHYVPLPDIDAPITALYRYVLRPVYTWPVQLLLLLIVVAGGVTFLKYLFGGGLHSPPARSFAALTVVVAAAVLIHLVLHELAHAVTCKHFGREVHQAALGLYFFLPVLSVDTSDVWMADKRTRAIVALSGPYTNLLLSGIATLAIPFITDGSLQRAFFQFAAAGYILGLANLNPLMEFDGYYVLMDWLDVPNLRAKAMAYVGSKLLGGKSQTKDQRLQRIYALYGGLAVLYVLVVAALILTGYQHEVEDHVKEVLPPLAAAVLGWSLAGLMVWVTLNKAWSDLRRGVDRRQRAHS